MPKAECLRCGAISESDNFQEAIDRLDHGIGLHNGRPCPNDLIGNTILWNGLAVPKDRTEPKPVIIESSQKKETITKKSNK